ncbi:hypothetical protein CAPTEDRAFT_211850 [Capitella teleta]|uniref:OTU domain-containing protein n=1 Tax=Capitella teleta TaxID=283909 RepID=R7U5Z0_CAPTE|nr:hypothetical protein CAPTEDRAFT_211850 [Capitella teleta]|eukprot:ELU01394.1 hypothetical protein CAPTEDRAFT_211850 [Capitella teleta]
MGRRLPYKIIPQENGRSRGDAITASMPSSGNDCVGLNAKQVLQNLAPFRGKPWLIKEKAATWKVDDFCHREQPSVSVDRYVDSYSNALMRNLGLGHEGVTLQTTGDGGCLFNAVSLSLTGSERSASELRARTALEMALHREYYVALDSLKDAKYVCPTFDEALNACISPNGFSSACTIQALATVIGIPIMAINPRMPGNRSLNNIDDGSWFTNAIDAWLLSISM